MSNTNGSNANQSLVSVILKGRTGNRLFQLAFLYTYSKRYGMKPIIFNQMIDPKLDDDNLFQHFWASGIEKRNTTSNDKFYRIAEKDNEPCFYNSYLSTKYTSKDAILLFDGYLQTEKYFKDYSDDIRKLILGSEAVTEKQKYFIHVRGGDYVNHPILELKGINRYYERCITEIGWDSRFLIFTDDERYLKSLPFYAKLTNFEIAPSGNEIQTLRLIAECSLGGITANSSFSWWGSWLNPNLVKKVFMPKPWFPNTITNLKYDDIYPSYATVMSIA